MGFSTAVAFSSERRWLALGNACAAAAAAVGLPAWAGEKMAERLAAGGRPRVAWLPLCECAGCGEALLGASPDGDSALVDVAVLDAPGAPDPFLEASLARGGFVLVVEGARRAPGGALELTVSDPAAARRLVASASAVVAVGSCAAPPASGAAPTLAVERGDAVFLPGCPVDRRRLLGTILQLATFGTLPALDAEGRPSLAYGRVVHEGCPRRPHFDAGRFARAWGDAGHRAGHCLYELGCAGPRTAARCSLLPVCEAPGGWALATGHPCAGCAEQGIAQPPSARAAPRPGAPLDAASEDLSGIARVRAMPHRPSARGRRAG